jgi:REP element-mobilizing transposase RayT
MAWPLRMYEPRGIYFVTARCFQGRLLLRPSRETNEVLGGVLARATRLAGVELFAFVFASNHLHLLVRAPQGNLPRFMQFLLANVSRKIGWLVGWRGAFWERRYSAEPVLDDEALFGRVRYILAHGVK